MFKSFSFLYDWSSSSIAIVVFTFVLIGLAIARLKRGLWPFDRPSDRDLDWDLGFYTRDQHEKESDR